MSSLSVPGSLPSLPFLSSLHRVGGAEGIRTPDPRRAKAVLSQLSYVPVRVADARAKIRTWDLHLIRVAL